MNWSIVWLLEIENRMPVKNLRECKTAEVDHLESLSKSKKIKKQRRDTITEKRDVKGDDSDQHTSSQTEERSVSPGQRHAMEKRFQNFAMRLGKANTPNMEIINNFLDGISDCVDDRVIFICKNSESIKVVALDDD